MAKSAEEIRMPCCGDGRMGERDRIKLGSENKKKKEKRKKEKNKGIVDISPFWTTGRSCLAKR
jgi:hypothetical protein